MAHVLKRKRGEAEATISVKRTKSTRKRHESTPTLIDGSRIFLNQTNELTQLNVTEDQKKEPSDSTFIRPDGGLPDAVLSVKGRKSNSWKLSSSTGGRIIKCDPVFTADEKYLIVANLITIQVYTTADSLLYRSIPLQLDATSISSTRIVTICLSSTETNKLWVACSDGSIFCVDWTTGVGAGSFWTVSSTGCKHMTVASMLSLGRRRDVIFTTETRKDGGFRTTAFELADPNGPIAIAARTIYTSLDPIQSLKAASDGSIIVGASGKRILVGRLRSTAFDTIDKIKFEFRTFESKDLITSLDIRFPKISQPEAIKKDDVPKIPVVDLVVGNIRGVIFVHTDLATKLFNRTGKGMSHTTTSLIPSKHHWHRQAVNSVKWSLDGNYILSGGKESTLVIWQLETGKRDFLPHMSAVIENVVVSPTGSSYAVLLSDNSAMVLSTTDLLPKFNIAGVQAPIIQVIDSKELEALEVPRAEGKIWPKPLMQRISAVVNPAISSSMLLAVGPTQEVRATKPFIMSNPFLQEFDLSTSRSTSIQALTRTNITNVNAAPDAHSITEPRVTHMKVSSDGLWLATVDEWVPPTHDFEFLGHSGNEIIQELYQRREVHLKFWQRNKELNTWELVSRIDKPHGTSDGYGDSGNILDLVSHPYYPQFATIGNDGSVKIWLPRSRKRDGVLVHGQKQEVLKNWSCLNSTKLRKLDLQDGNGKSLRIPTTGCVSFSEDGSVLAAALGSTDGLIFLIDSKTGIIRASHPGIIEDEIFGMEFLGQDLIILSRKLLSFDVVAEKLRHSFQIRSSVNDLSVDQKHEMMHLAVDHTSRTFAVALPKPTNRTKEQLIGFRSELMIFHPDSLEPQFKDFHHCLIAALLPAVSSEGFLVLDANAEIRTILPKGTQSVTSLAQSTIALQLDTQSEDFSDLRSGMTNDDDENLDEEDETLPVAMITEHDEADDEFPVVTRNQLAEIFDVGPAFALPPIEDLFYQVTGLFISKPLTQSLY
ncbi:hypothetical protein K3495_g4929 [Podosphaera aphanis]|nr:hypothetical protein K3495_g4929 [Podosphaera aphanis]